MPIQDVKIKEIPIVLDGKEYMMRLDFYAMGLLEEEGYGNIFKLVDDMDKHPFKNIPILIWCMIQHEDEKLTVKKVAKIMPYNIEFMDYFMNLIIKQINSSMPEKDPNVVTNPVEK